MTIKKPMKLKTTVAKPAAAETAGDVPELPSAPATGGATIADRFKLDIDNAPKATGGGKAAAFALVAGLAALAVAGILTFVIYQHWEFLKGA